MLNIRRMRRAFTLLELLTVVAMIALLAGILIPTMSRARAAARVVVCSGNLRQIDSAFKIWQETKIRDRPYMHMPDTFGWISAVKTITKEDRILYCPDGGKSSGTVSAFGVPTITTKKKNNGGHPTTWTPDPNPAPAGAGIQNANSYSVYIEYQQAHSDYATILFTRVFGDLWKITITHVDPPKGYGGGPIDLAWGSTTWLDVQQGQTFYYTAGGATGTNYGYNLEMSDVKSPKAGKVVAMDYDKMWIDYDGLNSDDDVTTKYLVGRHTDKRYINVLFTDSSVRLMTVKDMKAATGIYHNY